jgi:hypothetical protein
MHLALRSQCALRGSKSHLTEGTLSGRTQQRAAGVDLSEGPEGGVGDGALGGNQALLRRKRKDLLKANSKLKK